MSKIFSKVEAYDACGMQSVEFRTPGWILDEDDFLECDGMDEFVDVAEGDIEVEVQIYSFGDGESVSADDADMKMLTEDECDCIEVRNFVIIKED